MGTLQQFREEDAAQMRRVGKAVVDVLVPFLQGGTHPLLVVIALTRCLRVMLRKASKADQEEIRATLFAYIEGRTQAPGESMLWTPGSDDGRIN